MKQVLVLGAGAVARPAVGYLLEKEGVEVVVANRNPEKAEALVAGHPGGRAVALDAGDTPMLERAIVAADIVVSLLPWTLHSVIAELCLAHGKHMVTASYVKEEMQAMDREARDKGLIFLNEVGVDPGLDHMSAMQIIDAVHAEGGKIDSFFSYCGGLPALESNNNPLGYKFSWSPEGAMLAATNEGRYMEHGKVYEVPGDDLFKHYWLKSVPGAGVFEAYVNRDAMPYVKIYGIEDASGMYRGTLRNVGYCETWDFIKQLGLLNRKMKFDFDEVTPREVLANIVHCPETNVRAGVAAYLKIPEYALTLKKLEWLGLLSDRKLPIGNASVFDMFAYTLKSRLVYDPGEMDLLVMHHEFEIIYPNLPRQRIQSTLIDCGDPEGDSSMSRTVGYPVGIAAGLVAEGRISRTGVLRPVSAEIYTPVLAECERLGIRFKERRSESDTDELSYWGD
ncbi:saccharopine dehydrogenase C-terminal domain-containing protein [Desulfosarcina sp.]|uniref:saccharopine dehydrogenase C-terminal domain-containing protein n=1 Tax=Desulfosarcina sp. TaxID=2027861 RepID=UPI0029A2F40E|nr:saccharopine dehydrogenase C-terminal domain-containing protein [Desulfosarcina sp.]MDX2453771.1 saccharopine dehydrogenase C-terminal domain-containing protein [Desulfosarcina sp.]